FPFSAPTEGMGTERFPNRIGAGPPLGWACLGCTWKGSVPFARCATNYSGVVPGPPDQFRAIPRQEKTPHPPETRQERTWPFTLASGLSEDEVRAWLSNEGRSRLKFGTRITSRGARLRSCLKDGTIGVVPHGALDGNFFPGDHDENCPHGHGV